MRVPFVAFCTLAACVSQDYANPAQAQELPEADSPNAAVPDAPFSDQEELVAPVPSLNPEAPATARFSSASARLKAPEAAAVPNTPDRFENQPLANPDASSQALTSQSSSHSTTEILVKTEPQESQVEPTRLSCLEDNNQTTTDLSLVVSAVPESTLEETSESTASGQPAQTSKDASECGSTVLEPETSLSPILVADISQVTVDKLDDEPEPDSIETTPENTEPEPTVLSPLERPPGRLFNLETANQLPDEALQLSVGTHQTLPDSAPGTGDQLYYGSIDWGATDDLQLSLAYQNFDDSPADPINGVSPNITLESVAPSIKYRVLETESLALGVQGSVEYFSFASDLFNSDDEGGDAVIGSVHVPLTYTASPELQFHLTPGVSFFPDDINDIEFYDTIFSVGTGASWQPSERWLAYGTVNLPIGPGGNTIDNDQSISRQPVWTVGTRYNVTPRTGVDVYATNGFGVTPATGILSFPPDGDNLLVGVQLNYTPDNGLGYRSSYRNTPPAPLSERDRQLQLDGLTLTSANTLEPGTVAFNAGAGTDGNYSVGLAYSPDEALQVEAILEEFAEDDSVDPADTAGDDLKYMVGARLQLLDQHQGDPVSLAARILGGRDTASGQQVGTIFVDVPVTFQANSRTALFLNPRLAAFGNESNVGIGLGVNHEVARGLQLIGEVTPVFDGDRTVWAVGTRYSLPKAAVSLDLYATNAVGRNGLGTVVGQSEARFGVGFNWMIGR
ncbi:porin [Leptolyngbya cf. ectocarpi LEGE 11479]|uniref:Porin n=1 Tax=Leptolyngbya cf. ectocarpi LEGE 11479 TaxID=1828722 RepID=A0A928ZWE1_LEPEC|nr:porin [Leptolyngbya ectocarpi]MBE9068698.1 porin [Leptolyngbya cf. ectocarpi LEGE 11479]